MPTILLLALVAPCPWAAADHLRLNGDAESETKTGEILYEAQNGGILFQQSDGQLLVCQADEIASIVDDDLPVEPLSPEALGESLLAELPAGFRIHQTDHYTIAYQTELSYAHWIANLYENRLFGAFEGFWKRKKGFELSPPKFPLVAILFATPEEYARYVQRELGDDPGQMVAYYSVASNRVAMYDLTRQWVAGDPVKSERRIREVLSNPLAIPMVATIIHEGTHQLMFNLGMQTRLADSPLWINEGLAIYFETPDLRNSKGWRLPGLVNHDRLSQFAASLPDRAPDSLQQLIRSDARFHDPEIALDAYAESWALNHFLLNRKSKKYIAYLGLMSKKEQLVDGTEAQRLADFEQFFGKDYEKLNAELLEYLRRL